MFKVAAGWLGWPPDVILRTPICQLRLAIEGKVDFIKATNPFGGGEEEKPEPKQTEESAANALHSFFMKRHANDLQRRK